MDENLGLALLRDLQQQSSQFHSTDEFMQYMKDADIALETVKNILLEDGPPEKVLQRCFHMLIVFYDADWCGALNADLDLDIFTPVWWEDAREGFLSRTLFNEFEIPQKFSRWKNALKKKELVVIEDAEAIRDIYPEEYANYQRLDVHSVIGAPYYKGSTGFLVVRNPKRYMQQTLPLVMTSYIVAAETHDIRLMLATEHQFTSEDIREKNDVIISLFGGLTIATSIGTIQPKDISGRAIASIIAMMALDPEHGLPTYKIERDLYPDDYPGTLANRVKNQIYHFRKDFGSTFTSSLIETGPNGYFFSKDLNIRTDLQMFDNLIAQSKAATDPVRKAFLIRQAVKLYKGNVFPEAETEEWLRPVSMRYLERYLAAIYKLCELLYDQKDYSRIHEYVVQALKVAPEEEKLYYWMIISLRKRDMVELAKKALETAKNTLDEEYYDLLVEQLNGFRKP